MEKTEIHRNSTLDEFLQVAREHVFPRAKAAVDALLRALSDVLAGGAPSDPMAMSTLGLSAFGMKLLFHYHDARSIQRIEDLVGEIRRMVERLGRDAELLTFRDVEDMHRFFGKVEDALNNRTREKERLFKMVATRGLLRQHVDPYEESVFRGWVSALEPIEVEILLHAKPPQDGQLARLYLSDVLSLLAAAEAHQYALVLTSRLGGLGILCNVLCGEGGGQDPALYYQVLGPGSRFMEYLRGLEQSKV